MQHARLLGCAQQHHCAQRWVLPAGVATVVAAEVERVPETMESSCTRGPRAPETSSGGTLPVRSWTTALLTHPPVPWWVLGRPFPGHPSDAYVYGGEGTASLQLGLGSGVISCMVMILRYHLW